jgi:thioredoxin-like negative regulator of GroEL
VNDSGEGVYDLFREGIRFLDEGHPGPAALRLSRAARLAPEKNSIREALGRARFALGDFRGAEAAFATIVDRVPDNDYAHFGLARSLLAQARATEALRHARLAAALRPESSEYRTVVAACRTAARDGASPDVER